MSDYGFIHEDRVFTPNATQGVRPDVNSDRNAAIERAELDAWSKQPDVFVAYGLRRRDARSRVSLARTPATSGRLLEGLGE